MTASDTTLRERLVDAGVELLAAEGPQALTLREIARRAGVSHGAPRRYFPTHRELLSAIARRGFAELAARTEATLAREPADPRARVAALARTYVEFSLDSPGMYELMFRHDLLESGHLGLRETSLPLFALLTELVGRAGPEAQARQVAGALWANLHGLAQLWRWRSLQLAVGEDDLGALLDAVLRAHLGPGSDR
ncbi:transcriptional regulator, TetR family [Streptomyces sp. 1222.5]|uniref:TetR/AcrR family transcriptional regulator n=1 Tax=unclassified Streptomyces TaxID=2593676 RepID=UPI000898A13F|nr:MULTISPECIES: TetR/AcrR family transcriptional regulator [unclassified Streptomyces]PKW11172.1 TetR family transcriptional regulator [Streptomyces sp. 5112.2]SEB86148.1 transcriptional regulator, TetR family [Streptomyces sp. 1222.5]